MSRHDEGGDPVERPADTGLKLTPTEQQLLLDEIPQIKEQLSHPEAKRRYSELLASVQDGELDREDVNTLERLLELGLETGRIRKVHTAHGEMTAMRLYRRTPTGRALQATVDDVNAALTTFAGQTLRGIAFSLRAPAVYEVQIETDRYRIRIETSRDGIRVHEAGS